jgi:hypothetical protein
MIENAANPALQIIYFMTFILPGVKRKKYHLHSSRVIGNRFLVLSLSNFGLLLKIKIQT